MKKINMAYVILHYNADKETCDCIDSIKRTNVKYSYHVVVVDNASPNKSGVILREKYKGDTDVDVLLLDSNLGFANGNNVGIEHIRRNYECDFICCLNNDTIVFQNNMFSLLCQEYKKSGAAIIGPRIKLSDGTIQASAYELDTLDNYKRKFDQIKSDHYEKKDNAFAVKFPVIYKKIRKIKNDFFNHKLLFRHEDVVLHGCCLFFTPAFFEVLEGFDRRTFLYREEELLYIAAMKNGLRTVYNPSLKILHLEDAATNTIAESKDEKRRFIKENQLMSLSILIEELEGDSSYIDKEN